MSQTASQNNRRNKKMAEIKELENMILRFRVFELQMVLAFAKKRRNGRKAELQTRALELLCLGSHPIELKIREIYQKYYGQQQPSQAVSSGEELPPADQALPPTPRTNPVDETTGYTSVTPQQTTSATLPPKVSQFSVQIQSQCPVQPNIRLKKLPFYDVLAELLKPSSLIPQSTCRDVQDNRFLFHLTPQQSTDIATSCDCQVQIRFCLQDTSCEQEDCFPPVITVIVNGILCLLHRSMIPVEPPRPVQIGASVKLFQTVANHIRVIWWPDFGRHYAIAVYLVRKLSSATQLSRLKSRDVRHSDYTKGLIKEKLNEDADSGIATTSLRVSLACPLGKIRMVTPCRASTCSHLQCFDASFFLQMNERNPTWRCPVCDKPALYDTLVVDGYFQEVLNSKKLLPDENTIQLLRDGSWENLVLKKKKEKDKTESKVVSNSQDRKSDVNTVDHDESNLTPSKENKRAVVIDLTQSTKKPACGTSLPKNSQTSYSSPISNANDSSVLIIDYD